MRRVVSLSMAISYYSYLVIMHAFFILNSKGYSYNQLNFVLMTTHHKLHIFNCGSICINSIIRKDYYIVVKVKKLISLDKGYKSVNSINVLSEFKTE